MPRFTNLFISLTILLVPLGLALYQATQLLQELLPTQQLSASSTLMQARDRLDFASPSQRRDDDHGRRRAEQYAIDILWHQVQDMVMEALTYREEIQEIKGRVLEFQRGIRKTPNFKAMDFLPLKDRNLQLGGDSDGHHYFMSVLKGRGTEEGPPELFFFPQGSDDPRVLCIRGNSTSDGTQNAYAFVKSVPTGAKMVPGVTLVSDTFWDFTNPWHSMSTLLQFVHWRLDSGCSHADNLLLFHRGEFRTSLGSWIKMLLQACGLPTTALSSGGGGSHAAMLCFEQAIVNRSGIKGMKRQFRRRMFNEVRCQARRVCDIRIRERAFGGHVNVTLMVRHGARGFVDEAAWQRVVKEQCEAALNCSWSVMYVANLTFCQQVETMAYTDLLVSAHGAQLTNIIFMEPGGRLMEMFPFGWLEMAGSGQFVYRNLASWLGLQHEGYWRDPSTTPCPNVTDVRTCFDHYKDRPIGIDVNYIGNWLKNVIKKFNDPSFTPQKHDNGSILHVNSCECDSNSK